MTDSKGGETDPFQRTFDDAIEGIQAAARVEPYQDEILRTAYLGASALIDGTEALNPSEQITYRRKIAKMAGELATAHGDQTTASEMSARVEDCDKILNLISPLPEAAKSEVGTTKPRSRSAPKKRGTDTKKADTSAGKTSRGKGR